MTFGRRCVFLFFFETSLGAPDKTTQWTWSNARTWNFHVTVSSIVLQLTGNFPIVVQWLLCNAKSRFTGPASTGRSVLGKVTGSAVIWSVHLKVRCAHRAKERPRVGRPGWTRCTHRCLIDERISCHCNLNTTRSRTADDPGIIELGFWYGRASDAINRQVRQCDGWSLSLLPLVALLIDTCFFLIALSARLHTDCDATIG